MIYSHICIPIYAFLYDKNNSHKDVWFQAALPKTNYYIVSSNYFCLIIAVRFHSVICFQVTNDNIP